MRFFRPRVIPTEKQCRRCNEIKPIGEFKLPSIGDGINRYGGLCPLCDSLGSRLPKFKRCIKCREVKDILDFTYRSSASYEQSFNPNKERTRYKNTCSTCRPAAWKEWYASWVLAESMPIDRTPRPLDANRMRPFELEKFESRVTRTDTCWLWTGALNAGYGMFSMRRKTRGAHRIAYKHWIGTPPDGLHLDHLCGVKNCVNPWHLQPITPRENKRRGSKNRSFLRQFQPTVSSI